MLDTHRPAAVLEFMATLRRSDSPNRVRLAYLERFAAVLEHDLYAHWRSAKEPLEPERAGCVAPELPRDEARSQLLLEASFDCDSPLVRSDFDDPTRVFVEWTLTIDERTSGYYFLAKELPEDVESRSTAAIGSSSRARPALVREPPRARRLPQSRQLDRLLGLLHADLRSCGRQSRLSGRAAQL